MAGGDADGRQEKAEREENSKNALCSGERKR
jgi:hypothetical protein